jgi:hypothetical protein
MTLLVNRIRASWPTVDASWLTGLTSLIPSHGPVIGFRLPVGEYELFVNHCAEGQSVAALAKAIVTEWLAEQERRLDAPARGFDDWERSRDVDGGPDGGRKRIEGGILAKREAERRARGPRSEGGIVREYEPEEH